MTETLFGGPVLPPAYPERAAWGTAPKLRAWQQEALDSYFSTHPRDFLAVATPGAAAVARVQDVLRVVRIDPEIV